MAEQAVTCPLRAVQEARKEQREVNLPSITAFLETLQASSWAAFIHKKAWAFTTIEVIHVFAVSLVLGTIAIVDLRLLGLASTKRPFAELSRQVLPLTWAAFALAVIAGSLLFISRATEYFVSPVFWIKMSLIAVAGINMMIFEFITVRDVQKWNLNPTPPPRARLAGGISITCWVLIIVFGRLIEFSLQGE
jgi:uncharacterized membrane protein